MSMISPIDRARQAWNGEMPDWVGTLAQACAESSQNRVAKRLGVSASLISNVLGNRYPGDLVRIEDLVRGAYEARTVECPALGTLALDRCRAWRKRSAKLQNANAQNVRMFRACNRCPLNTGGSHDQV